MKNNNDIKVYLKKRRNRTMREQFMVDDLHYKLLFPVRIIIFPIMLIVRLYNWAYNK